MFLFLSLLLFLLFGGSCVVVLVLGLVHLFRGSGVVVLVFVRVRVVWW